MPSSEVLFNPHSASAVYIRPRWTRGYCQHRIYTVSLGGNSYRPKLYETWWNLVYASGNLLTSREHPWLSDHALVWAAGWPWGCVGGRNSYFTDIWAPPHSCASHRYQCFVGMCYLHHCNMYRTLHNHLGTHTLACDDVIAFCTSSRGVLMPLKCSYIIFTIILNVLRCLGIL